MMDGAMRREELDGLIDIESQHVADRLSSPQHGKRLGVEARAVARLAGDFDVGQEAHLDGFHPLALALGAAAARSIEREAARAVAAHGRFVRFGVEPADRIPEADVSRGAGAWSLADRR